MLQFGEVLGGRYRLIGRLSRSSADETTMWQAWDERTSTEVAILAYPDAHPETQRAFRAEAQRLTRLTHPQLPHLRDQFSDPGRGCFLVWDFVAGYDLRTLVEQFYPLPSRLIVSWLREVCNIVAYLHEQETLHLAITPANVRLTADGRVFLVGTGLLALGIPTGKEGYSAPEQVKQQKVGVSADIFALGGVLYTLLTNTIPPASLPRELGVALLRNAREINDKIDPALSMVASRALSLLPAARYNSAGELASALPQMVEESALPPPAPLPLPPKRALFNPTVRRTMERRTIYALATVLLGMVLFAASIGRLRFNQQSAELISPEPSSVSATITNQIALAFTQIAQPFDTPTPSPTPTPTPAPRTDEKTGAEQLFIPSGQYTMGNNDGEDDEKPAHRVQIRPFYLDRTEVSNAHYAVCVQEGACSPPRSRGATYYTTYYDDPAFANYPVIFVDWEQANQFCQWRGGRLPTEAEWEYAAGFRPSVGKKTLYPWGELLEGATANFCDKNCTLADQDPTIDDGYQDTAPVGQFSAGNSAFGVADLAGNVLEWVADWYDARYYADSLTDDPLGPATGVARVVRGGSFFSAEEELRVTVRGSYVPEVARAHLGFRCATNP